MEKYKNKYRIKSHRMPNWDYSSNGLYFLNLVTQHRICNLGEIINKKMILSHFGKIVETEFLKSFEIRNELFLDEFIIMPNHLHTIVVINKPKIDIDSGGSGGADKLDKLDESDGSRGGRGGRGARGVVEMHGRASLPSTKPTKPTKSTKPKTIIRLPQSISSFLAGFKSSVNSKIDDFIDDNRLNIPKYNRNNHFFQPNYHDHIIRNDTEYKRIKNYIINNPANWDNDKFNTVNTQ